MSNLQEIEVAITKLSLNEYEQLLRWLDENNLPQPVEAHLKVDLKEGRMDELIKLAVEDYQAGRTTPL